MSSAPHYRPPMSGYPLFESHSDKTEQTSTSKRGRRPGQEKEKPDTVRLVKGLGEVVNPSSRVNFDAVERLLAPPSPTESCQSSDADLPDPSPSSSSRDAQATGSQTTEAHATTTTTALLSTGKRPRSPTASASSSTKPSQSFSPSDPSRSKSLTAANKTTQNSARRFGVPLDVNSSSLSSSRPLSSTPTTHSSRDDPPYKRSRNDAPTLKFKPNKPNRPSPPDASPIRSLPQTRDDTATQRRVDHRPLPRIPQSLTQAPLQSTHDRFLALARLPGRRKPFQKNVDKPFRDAAARAADAYLKDPSDANLLLFLELPKRWLTPALQDRQHPARWRLEKFMKEELEWPEVRPADKAAKRDKVHDTTKLVELGRLGTGCRVLTEDTVVADITDETVAALVAKHPPGPTLPFGLATGPVPGRAPTKDDVLRALQTFDPDTSPGISGWTARMLNIVIESPTVLEFLTILTASIFAGTAPGKEMLCSSRLTPLGKPDGGIRPVAVGEVMYRLAMKAILEKALDGKKPLLPYQLGVKTKGGVEPVVRAVERAMDGTLDQEYTHLVSLDASNAFNAIDRKVVSQAVHKFLPGLFRCARWAYQLESDLVVGDRVIRSRQGVRQGDPLAPLLFSLGLRPALDALSVHLGPNRKVLAYLDDIFILSTDDKALGDTKRFLADYRTTLQLNPNKCKMVNFEEISENGFQLLGTTIGGQAARTAFLRRAIGGAKQKISHLSSLDHQSALLLLRKCISADLRHLQRSLRTDDIREEWDPLDLALWEEVKRIRGRPDIEGAEGIEDDCIGRDAASLPARFGGLDLLSHRDVSPHARAAAEETADQVVDDIFGTKHSTEERVSRSQAERCREMWEQQRRELMRKVDSVRAVAVLENASVIGRKWLNTIPFFHPLRLSDAAISTGLAHRTLARAHRPVCKCGTPAEFLHEEVCTRIGLTARHNNVRDIIAASLRKIPSTEVITEPRTSEGLRRNDIGLRGPGRIGRRNIDYDLKIYSPNSTFAFQRVGPPVRLPHGADPIEYFSAHCEHWMARVESRTDKNKPESRVDFKPLVFTSGGLMARDTAKEIRSWMELDRRDMSRMMEAISVALLMSRARNRGACLLLNDDGRDDLDDNA